MTQPRHMLRQILVKTAENTAAGRPSLAVFDLDSTLFDVGPRLERILMDFAQVPEHIRLFPEQVKHFANMKIERKDWGVKDALIRAGLDGHHPEFQIAVRDFWKKTFFSNDYLRFDRPYAGAVEYVQALAKAGAAIAYLTGRDVARMGQGSADVLKHWDFPLDDKTSTLELKPVKEMDDAAFKTDWFLALPQDHYKDIWFFENEPVNINKMRVEAAHVEIVFFDSTHSRREELKEDLPRIMHYLLEGED